MYHKPVLLKEAIDGLNIREEGIYVDVTYGGGGHTAEILKRLKKGTVIAFDKDTDALKNKISDKRLILLNNNFRYLKNFLKYYRAIPVDGIIADLGVSSHQFDKAERGFSFRFESKLDMRMDSRQKKTAADIVNEYTEPQLMEVFKNFGELHNSRQLAKKIAEYRKTKKIEKTEDLIEAIYMLIDKKNREQYLAKVFQALRIETNDEMRALTELLQQSLLVLKNGGRLVVISYHSLEDRLVKNFMKTGNVDGELQKDFYGNVYSPFRMITKKPITPDLSEIKENQRARSAKLRIAEKN